MSEILLAALMGRGRCVFTLWCGILTDPSLLDIHAHGVSGAGAASEALLISETQASEIRQEPRDER